MNDEIKACTFVEADGSPCPKPVQARGMCIKHYTKWLRDSKKAPPKPELPADLAEKVANAKSTEDWQELARGITPVMQGILDGTVKGTAGQVSLLKDILNRAYGKPIATQADKKTATGIVLLPTLLEAEKATLCPRCAFDAMSELDRDSIKVQLKALLDSL